MSYPIRIFMRTDHRKFDGPLRETFKSALAALIGCAAEDIQNPRFKDGCVIFEGSLDAKHAAALLLSYMVRNESVPSAEKEKIARFLREWDITGVDIENWDLLVAANRKGKSMHTRRIVLVHGWSGKPESFGDLPKCLREAFNCDVTQYSYPTGKLSHAPSITYVANHFADFLEQTVDAERIAIICHSMGGLIVKKAIVDEAFGTRRMDNKIVHLAFVASPSDGVALARILGKFPLLGSEQLTELEPGNPFLFDVGTKFAAWVARRVPKYCTLKCIVGTADGLVTVKNGSDFDSSPNIIPGADHSDIIRPKSCGDDIVTRLVWNLKKSKF